MPRCHMCADLILNPEPIKVKKKTQKTQQIIEFQQNVF